MTNTKKLKSSSPIDALADHPLFSGAQSVGMLSGENPYHPAEVQGHEQLGNELKQMGLQAVERQGSYGSPERSWMVYGPTREQLMDLGRKYGQDSVIFSDKGKDEMVYTNGDKAGHYHSGTGREIFAENPGDYYTHMPEANAYLRMGFDFDNLHPAPMEKSVDLMDIKIGIAQTLLKVLRDG